MTQYNTDPVWVGMDVHQDSVTCAILFGQDPTPQIERLPGDLNAVRRMFRRLSEHGTPRSCYEASGAGYVLQRCLEHDGFHCEVIAPSLVPKKPGDRRKTDRLDAIHLAEQYRSGNLVPVAVPTQEQEEIRQLVRSRLAVQSHVVLAHHLEHLEYLEVQKTSLEAEIDRYARSEPFRERVEALCCFRGIKTLTAMTILTELGDIKRFARPTGLMAFAGLVPSERSSGNVRRRGGITKSGSHELRRILVEASWHYRKRACSDLVLRRRRMGQNPQVVAIAVKAQHRLQKKYWKIAEKKHTCTAVTAVARELCGFIWSALWALEDQSN